MTKKGLVMKIHSPIYSVVQPEGMFGSSPPQMYIYIKKVLSAPSSQFHSLCAGCAAGPTLW